MHVDCSEEFHSPVENSHRRSDRKRFIARQFTFGDYFAIWNPGSPNCHNSKLCSSASSSSRC